MKQHELSDQIILGKRLENGERIEIVAVRHENGEFEIMDNRDGVVLTRDELARLLPWGREQLNTPRRVDAGAN